MELISEYMDMWTVALKIEEQPCRILLLGIVSTGLLKMKKGFYSNSLIAQIYLESQSPKNIINVVKWQHVINYKPMFHFYAALKENKNLGLQEFKGSEPTLLG